MKTTVYKGHDLPQAYKRYARLWRKKIETILTDIGGEGVWFSIGFHYWSCMVKRNGKFVYMSLGETMPTTVLVRTAAHEKDYTGGKNCYSPSDKESLKHLIRQLSL